MRRLWGRFSPDLDGQIGQASPSWPSGFLPLPLFFLEGAPPGLAQHFPAERAQSSTFRLAGSADTVRV
jgi:hypothetical protein